MEIRSVLIVRTDRIGDVVLTLPMAAALKRLDPTMNVGMLVRAEVAPIVAGHPDVDEILVIADDRRDAVRALLPELVRRRYDAAFCVSPRLRLAALLRRARIPVRVGTAYRWYSSLFTHRIHDHRKASRYHEAVYNLRMIGAIHPFVPDTPRLFIPLDLGAEAAVDGRLAAMGLAAGEYLVLHPGSGRSAKEWPIEHYAELARRSAGELGVRVVLTGSAAEAPLVESVRRRSGGVAEVVVGWPLVEFAVVLDRAFAVVTNSTGPLHLAVARGTFAVGFYPPIPHQGVVRWGPLGPAVAALTPPVPFACPACIGAACEYFDCMRLVRPADALEVLRARIAATAGNRREPAIITIP